MTKELEEPDAEMRKVLDGIWTPVFVLQVDSQGRPVYVFLNKIVRDEVSWGREHYFGKVSSEIFPKEGTRFSGVKHRECLQTGQPMTYEQKMTLGGVDRYIRTTLRPIKDEHGRVWRIIGTSINIDAEHFIGKVQAENLAKNTEIEQIINMSAHDLRSPMRNMQALTELLLDSHEDKGNGEVEIIQSLHTISHNTLSLIGGIMDYAQSTSATELVEAFEIKKLCNEVFSIHDSKNKHTLYVDDVLILGDKIATQIVIRNLIDNALKHNSETSIHLQILVSSKQAGYFQVVVRDNGIGLSAPEKLFTGEAPTRIDSGFGTQGVVRLLKKRRGDISAHHVESGQGVEIRFSLPGNIVEEMHN